MAKKTSAATEHIFKSGFPTTVTSRNAYDEADLQRAVTAYRFWYPRLSRSNSTTN